MMIQCYLDDGRILTLDSELKPLDCYLPVSSRARETYEAGKAVLLPGLLIRRGEREAVKIPMSLE